jgi:hypothetical protein
MRAKLPDSMKSCNNRIYHIRMATDKTAWFLNIRNAESIVLFLAQIHSEMV